MSRKNLENLRKILIAHHNPEKAEKMSAYLRDQFPTLGISSPELKTLIKPWIKEAIQPDKTVSPALIYDLWALSEREYQYVAIELGRKSAPYMDEKAIEMYEDMITRRSWWDTVDMVATNMVGVHFQRFPHQRDIYINAWLNSGNIWLQRTTLIFQLKHKEKTDWPLLKRNILALRNSNEFFIRKAIGWALREYSKSEPGKVKEFIGNTYLPELSTREGLKWLHKNEKK